MNLEKPIEIEINGSPEHTIIWLHGLGADGHDFVPIVNELKLSKNLSIRFIFPHAPIMPVTINNGYKMRSWFDILSLSDESKIDKEGIMKAITGIEHIINQEIARGIHPEKILLAGFSQGATMALATIMHYPQRLTGAIGLSGFLAPSMMTKPSHVTTPIFLAHGVHDNVVPFAWGELTRALLQHAGFPVEWHAYPVAHHVNADEVADIHRFIERLWIE